MQAHALTRTRYFYSLNAIISHPIVYKEGLGYLSVCAIASRSSPPYHVCIVTVVKARSYFASTVLVQQGGLAWQKLGSVAEELTGAQNTLFGI
jgi:hypothetical protein